MHITQKKFFEQDSYITLIDGRPRVYYCGFIFFLICLHTHNEKKTKSSNHYCAFMSTSLSQPGLLHHSEVCYFFSEYFELMPKSCSNKPCIVFVGTMYVAQGRSPSKLKKNCCWTIFRRNRFVFCNVVYGFYVCQMNVEWVWGLRFTFFIENFIRFTF